MKSFKQHIKEQSVATPPPAPPAIVRHMQGPTSTQKALKRVIPREVIPREVVPALEPTRLDHKELLNKFLENTKRLEGPKGNVTNDTGGVTKFGVSEKSGMKSEQIRNLSWEDAKNFYTKEHFEKLKPHLQGLGEHAALVALDASVNHRHGFALELIQKHGDDAKGMLESRRREYDRLAFANPDKYISYHNGWMNRLKYFKDRLQ